jgi:hypothetical protein
MQPWSSMIGSQMTVTQSQGFEFFLMAQITYFYANLLKALYLPYVYGTNSQHQRNALDPDPRFVIPALFRKN